MAKWRRHARVPQDASRTSIGGNGAKAPKLEASGGGRQSENATAMSDGARARSPGRGGRGRSPGRGNGRSPGRGRGRGRGRGAPLSAAEEEARRQELEEQTRLRYEAERQARQVRMQARAQKLGRGDAKPVGDDGQEDIKGYDAVHGDASSIEQLATDDAVTDAHMTHASSAPADCHDDTREDGAPDASNAREEGSDHLAVASPSAGATKEMETEQCKAPHPNDVNEVPDTGESDDDSDDSSDANVTCAACNSGADENQLLICDGCDRAQHTYCARPRLPEVPADDWFCETCSLKKHLIAQGQAPSRWTAQVRAELTQVTHGARELWRFKVGLATTCCQLMLHLRALNDAIDKGRLKPLIEECAELNRLERLARKEMEAQEQAMRRKEQAQQREIASVMESVIRQVERAAKRMAKLEAKQSTKEGKRQAKRDAREEKRSAIREKREEALSAKQEARQAKERARLEAQNERQAQREERQAQRVESEVQRCLDRLLTQVCGTSARGSHVRRHGVGS